MPFTSTQKNFFRIKTIRSLFITHTTIVFLWRSMPQYFMGYSCLWRLERIETPLRFTTFSGTRSGSTSFHSFTLQFAYRGTGLWPVGIRGAHGSETRATNNPNPAVRLSRIEDTVM